MMKNASKLNVFDPPAPFFKSFHFAKTLANMLAIARIHARYHAAGQLAANVFLQHMSSMCDK